MGRYRYVQHLFGMTYGKPVLLQSLRKELLIISHKITKQVIDLNTSLIFCMLPHIPFPDVSKVVFKLFPKTVLSVTFSPLEDASFQTLFRSKENRLDYWKWEIAPGKFWKGFRLWRSV